MTHNEHENWIVYRTRELQRVRPILEELGFELVPEQVHVSGERYLMSGKKLVLIGKRISDGMRVVIKVSSTAEGKRELEHEHRRRTLLPKLPFAYKKFHLPQELLYTERAGFLISITTFIDQERDFLDHSLREQFALILDAFKMQEALHATASGHTRALGKAFGMTTAEEYLQSFHDFSQEIRSIEPKNKALADTLIHAEDFLRKNTETIARYSGFLTHTDFVPHNVRISDGKVYLLDHTALQFGNKYESWARFMNYLILYNRNLEQALSTYLVQNRTPEELLSLQLMRIYKLGFLLKFYASNLAKTADDLYDLARLRIDFWTQTLEALLTGASLPQATVDTYTKERDRLRSEEEKERQKELGQLR